MLIKLLDDKTVAWAPGIMACALMIGCTTQVFGPPRAMMLALLCWLGAWLVAPRGATVIALGTGAWVIGAYIGARL